MSLVGGWKCVQRRLLENCEERKHFEKLSVDGKIILTRILNNNLLAGCAAL
jgi:hypothetical protein